MSVLKTCVCDKKNYRVVHKNHNHSHFEYPKGAEHDSAYSKIKCLECGWVFRSKAKWVDDVKDITKEETKKWKRQNILERRE